MSKAKPFLFGTALGASAMFVALQYHVVHSHDGFQMIPRTPQQSVGLAYADIRAWTPSQWTDRPELARALMAHGASDLISESVTNILAESVSEENSTLEELRSFLNKSESGKKSDSASDLSDQPVPAGSSKDPETQFPGNDLFRIPFPQDAKAVGPADPFRVARTTGNGQPAASGSRFSAADVLEGLNDDLAPKSTVEPNAATPRAGTTAAKNGRSVTEQTQEMEDRIFGNGSKTGGKPTVKSAPKSESTESMFEEVSTQLENRAQEALNRAKQVVSGKADAAAGKTAKLAEGFIRSDLKDVNPEKADSHLNGASGETAALSSPLKAVSGDPSKPGAAAETANPASSLLKDFDPFLE